ncbi:MAG: hypothetical protein HUJ99_02990 [Bacteroidaceae bacterium]|nr:hypothetical protein [Bacteroidaceae bacterium]
MKNFNVKTLILAACATAFTACSKDDNDKPTPIEVLTSYGVFVVNAGNTYNMINGSLDYIDLEKNTITNNVFEKVNGRALGVNANDAFAYGSKLYIAVDGEQMVEVVDTKTLESLAQIKLEGNARHLTAWDGKMYATAFNGEVCRIDTTTLEVDKVVAVGSYPEGMTVTNSVMLVANSGYGEGHTLSVIDLVNFKESKTIECPTNPVSFANDGRNIYLLCSGKYAADWTYEENPAVYKYDANIGNFTKMFDATAFCNNGEYIYAFDSNYYKPEVTYPKYGLQTGVTSVMDLSGDIIIPCAIAADPITKHLWVSSYNLGDSGYADYNAPGYIVEFDENGKKLHAYNTGVCPIAICFYNNLK